jgi:hypothetical protein
MRRVRVGVFFQGCDQYYQREAEVREGTKYVIKPSFVADKRQAITMSEDLGLRLVERLRSLKVNPFMEDVNGERRLDLPQQNVPSSGEDNRKAVQATLDDDGVIASNQARWYVVKPANTPNGPKWFLRIDLPGVTEPQIIYADDPLAVLQRASDMNFLQYAVKHEQPQPQQQAQAIQNKSSARRRPGDLYGS